MPMLVHITNDEKIASIRRGGIRVSNYYGGVYAMPVLENFVVSHQWLRELKRARTGSRTLAAVHFRIPDGETVLMGHYSQKHVEVAAAEACGAIMHAEDPLGMELMVLRTIAAKEIHAVRSVPQVVGWRYFPGAHGPKPCGCPCCQPPGKFKSRKLRTQYEADIRGGSTY